jgi:hypothetical protein
MNNLNDSNVLQNALVGVEFEFYSNFSADETAKKLAEFKKGSVKISEVETEAYLDEKDSIIFKHKGAWYKGLVNGEHNGVKYKINFQSK